MSNTHRIYHRHLLGLTFTLLFAGISSNALAGNLDLSDNALEIVIGVEPNIMILSDDSGSMDWAMATDETSFNWSFSVAVGRLNSTDYAYVHPDPGASGLSPAENTYHGGGDVWTAPTPNSLDDEGVASPYGGAWRYWFTGYNKIYYNPDVTYLPWEGVDNSGTAYANMDPANARYNPYRSANGTLDLTATISYGTECTFAGCPGGTGSNMTVNNFYPAMYYTWTDNNSDGVVDADEGDHLNPVEIKAANAPFTGRLAYVEATNTGRSDCTDNGDTTATCTYAQEIQNFANWFSYFRKRDLTAKAAFSRVIEPVDTARIGYATLHDRNSVKTRVTSMNVSPASGNKRALLDNIFDTEPASGTPLRQALLETGRYFACDANNIIDASSSSPGDANCPVLASPAGECQQNYAVVMTDGYWNNSSDDIGNEPGAVDDNPDNDGGDFSGGAYADSHDNTLADVAMHFYKTDLHGLDDEVPTSVRDINGYLGNTDPFETMRQHMSTYTVSFGVNGSLSAGPTDPSAAFTWPDPLPNANNIEKIDDLRHAAYNGRGQYLNAGNPVALTNAMTDIFSEIETATGTATAVAFNTQEVEAGTLVFRASFNTKTNEGDLIAQNINANGSVDPTVVWSAAEQLDAKISSGSDSRVIVTYKDIGSGSVGIPFQWSDLTFNGSNGQRDLLNSPQPANVAAGTNTFGDERLAYLRGQYADEGDHYDDGEFRERASLSGRLGDIVHSTPVFVGKPEFLGRDGGLFPSSLTGETPYSEFVTDTEALNSGNGRKEVTYVAANDGMLHGFETNTGSELFAYVPNIVMENLSNLTDPDYNHRFYVDLSTSINDAYFTPTRGTNTTDLSWNTVLVGGLRGGGKGYYALNITDPTALDSESEAAANVLWEFTEADDGGVGSSDLGFTYSQPLIAMSNATDGSGNQEWVVIFGNGYNSTSADGDAHLYVARLAGGQNGVWTVGSDYIKISTGNGKAESSDTTTPNGIGGIRGIDTDSNGTVDLVYAGDLQGNLYRFDISGATLGSWTGAPKTIFQAKHTAGAFPRTTVQPITTRPIVVPHPTAAGYIVITTTGSWMTTSDASSTEIQSIYGIWDDLTNTPLVTMGSNNNMLVEQVFSNHTNIEHGFTVRTLTNNTISWKNVGGPSTKVKGWYIDFDMASADGSLDPEYPGERAIRNLQLRGGILFISTVIPKDTGACSVGVGGYELGFNPVTGGSGVDVIFDINNDGSFAVEDNVGDNDGAAYIVTGIRFDEGTPSDSAFIGSRRMTQVGDEIRSFDTNTGTDVSTGRTSWREITP